MLSTLSGLLYVLGFVPYIIAILRGETRPSKATWMIWSLLDLITLLGIMSEHKMSATMLAATIGATIVAVLALIKGESGWTKIDQFCLFAAVIGGALWAMSHNANVVIISTMFITLVAAVPTIISAWTTPRAENKTAWMLYAIGCVLGVLAITEWSVASALQSVVFLVIDGTVCAIVWIRK